MHFQKEKCCKCQRSHVWYRMKSYLNCAVCAQGVPTLCLHCSLLTLDAQLDFNVLHMLVSDTTSYIDGTSCLWCARKLYYEIFWMWIRTAQLSEWSEIDEGLSFTIEIRWSSISNVSYWKHFGTEFFLTSRNDHLQCMIYRYANFAPKLVVGTFQSSWLSHSQRY